MGTNYHALSRRQFLVSSALLLAGSLVEGVGAEAEADPIIDIHQHTNYSGRANDQLIAHQRALGVTQTVLLPAGRLYGLDAGCGGNQTVVDLADKNPKAFLFFANEVADLPEAVSEIERYLKRGAGGIGEQKFRVECDSEYIERIAELAKAYGVPVLMHFQHGAYNTDFQRFYKILEKFPEVNFIGHAQTWWGNIDQRHDQTVMYPKGTVRAGGLTDRWLTRYPNLHGDLSAGSGLNALMRDEAHARGFLERHQDQLLFGSDCNDSIGRGPGCLGARILEAIRRLAPDRSAIRKIVYANAKRLLRFAPNGGGG